MATFADFDDVMNAGMDDIEDLPPVGVPPTGHYNLCVSAEVKTSEAGKQYVTFSYEVTAINEVRTEAEASQVAIGMKFRDNFHPTKKDGTVNEWGVKFLKQAVAPFAAHFGTSKMGDVIGQIDKVDIAATLLRKIKKGTTGDDEATFRLEDVTIL